ncbi:DUF4224 domain-containing protein [Salmonella enterica]|uniref:DUF4224 domain-containing protein n=4 Tax=Salmonella enterica TaxID=28901 RepID=A0A5X8XT55_SALNE|nr:DUF4224 domain-containing protein [Salmonella enterica subsp. enterica serovar Rubislaw]EAB1499815.1 DUF4224 domain-containing protein [Salmonella enterica]EAB6208807.1 DUF4224 domain-containing protein [Salmonella enterica subsp. enterica serovar Agbeni]EBF6639561.1 DUF4224 domain-containing protein [Salmonella enterica subsp. enterica serovar Reading]EBQ4754900.1 DUF4224 domain-containing protein [Salmonella enterica subsp. diarizonae]EBR9315607.1 DUF4224 domain-containing protein [Salmon
MSELFLTHRELEDLTGYRYASQQRGWLLKEGIPFRTNRMGHPKVNRYLFTSPSKDITDHTEEPDFGAI